MVLSKPLWAGKGKPYLEEVFVSVGVSQCHSHIGGLSMTDFSPSDWLDFLKNSVILGAKRSQVMKNNLGPLNGLDFMSNGSIEKF